MDHLLGLKETAARVGATESTLRYWVHLGQAPTSAKIGRRRMFRESDVQRWLDDHFERDGRPAA